MTTDISKIKDYWMATMNMGETREAMEEIWSTKDGLDNLMEWFEGEIEEGITEEEMDKEIARVNKTNKEDKEMADKNMVQITQIDIDGVRYTSTRPGYYYKKVDGGKQVRIPKAEWEQAVEKFNRIKEEEETKILPEGFRVESTWDGDTYSFALYRGEEFIGRYWDNKEAVEQAKKLAGADKEAEDAVNGKAKKEKKPRRSKDIAYDRHGVTLTAKQVDFIRHIPDTCFYEHGLDSTMWCDVLADEIGGQFAGKPMTVGAMISTLREKDLIYVQAEKVNGKKSKYFGFTEIGKEIAKELGLN